MDLADSEAGADGAKRRKLSRAVAGKVGAAGMVGATGNWAGAGGTKVGAAGKAGTAGTSGTPASVDMRAVTAGMAGGFGMASAGGTTVPGGMLWGKKVVDELGRVGGRALYAHVVTKLKAVYRYIIGGRETHSV